MSKCFCSLSSSLNLESHTEHENGLLSSSSWSLMCLSRFSWSVNFFPHCPQKNGLSSVSCFRNRCVANGDSAVNSLRQIGHWWGVSHLCSDLRWDLSSDFVLKVAWHRRQELEWICATWESRDSWVLNLIGQWVHLIFDWSWISELSELKYLASSSEFEWCSSTGWLVSNLLGRPLFLAGRDFDLWLSIFFLWLATLVPFRLK